MSSTLRIVMALAVVGTVAACAKKTTEEVVYIDQPVTVEPTYTGKYK